MVVKLNLSIVRGAHRSLMIVEHLLVLLYIVPCFLEAISKLRDNIPEFLFYLKPTGDVLLRLWILFTKR